MKTQNGLGYSYIRDQLTQNAKLHHQKHDTHYYYYEQNKKYIIHIHTKKTKTTIHTKELYEIHYTYDYITPNPHEHAIITFHIGTTTYTISEQLKHIHEIKIQEDTNENNQKKHDRTHNIPIPSYNDLCNIVQHNT